MNALSMAFLYKIVEEHKYKIIDYDFKIAVAKIRSRSPDYLRELKDAKSVAQERLSRLEEELENG